MDEDLSSDLYEENLLKLAIKLRGWIKTRDGNLLQIVRFKKDGKGFYWSISDKAFAWVDRGLQWYYVTGVSPDEQGRVVLYSPFVFSSGIICRVPVEDFDFVGYN